MATSCGAVGAAVENLDIDGGATNTHIDALIDAMGRSVAVRVVMDPWEANEDVIKALDDAGVPVRCRVGHDGGIMHHKFAVLDEQAVISGSFNYTDAASTRNDESLMILQDPAQAAQYTSAFEELWARVPDTDLQGYCPEEG